MLGPLSATYKANKDLDSLNVLYLLVPCGILACVIYPAGNYATLDKMLWAFALYAEAVSNLPQLYMFQVMGFLC